MMKWFSNLAIFCVIVISLSAKTEGSSTGSRAQFHPPDWILGEWANVAESNSDQIETFVFSKNDIQFTRGYLYHGKIQFSRAFKNHDVRETIDSDLYRVEMSMGDDKQSYEFRFCRSDKCPSLTKDVLTYSFTKNNKTIREHLTSINNVLFKRTRLK